MNPKTSGLLWLTLALVLGASLSLGLPYFAKWVPRNIEDRIGRTFEIIPTQLICTQNPTARRLFEKVIHRIYPLTAEEKKFPITFEVVRGTTINAFAALGGHIFIYDGLLKQAESADELAGVLAHEIEHV